LRRAARRGLIGSGSPASSTAELSGAARVDGCSPLPSALLLRVPRAPATPLTSRGLWVPGPQGARGPLSLRPETGGRTGPEAPQRTPFHTRPCDVAVTGRDTRALFLRQRERQKGKRVPSLDHLDRGSRTRAARLPRPRPLLEPETRAAQAALVDLRYAAAPESASVITTPGTIASASTVFCSSASGCSRAARPSSSASVTPVSTITGGLCARRLRRRKVS
jgi:hypothetical protein